ncbi:hypothetical protein IFM89_008442 [Coptis chinensis]|uniref:Uncharacterized protein n=1 Tax=Coptis chinensis TaxID=261450 RepID=A0A835LZP4_9MAGN|nr:hypothetical protein IFM89_008442 [Coptis chinensis]
MDPERNGESQDNRSNVDQPHIQKKRKASRGTTVMLEMTKNWDGKVITVEYDQKGRPTPRAVRRKIAGYEGALARVMVPLNAFSDWRKLKDFWGGQLEKDLWATMQFREHPPSFAGIRPKQAIESGYSVVRPAIFFLFLLCSGMKKKMADEGTIHETFKSDSKSRNIKVLSLEDISAKIVDSGWVLELH